MKKYTLLLIAVCLLFTSCKENNQLGEYVYVDYTQILHTKSNCKSISEFTTGGKPVVRIRINELSEKDWNLECAECVSDEQYKKILSILHFYSDIAVDNQRKLYDLLKNNYQDIQESFNVFQKTIADTNTLRMYYNRIVRDDCALFLPDFESLLVDLGLDPDNPAKLKLLL